MIPAGQITRRELLGYVSRLLLALPFLQTQVFAAVGKDDGTDLSGKVMTVRGAIDPSELGLCLAHEHIVHRFGDDPAEPPSYDQGAVIERVLSYLKYVKTLGARSIVDCNAMYFGRDPELLKELSEASGLHIVTNTGYYAASEDRYVPVHAHRESAERIARYWIEEFEKGIQSTGVRPGFIKCAVDPGPLSEIDAKLVRAAAITHRETGLTMAVHTGNNPDAVDEQLTILQEEGVRPEAWMWTHAQNVKAGGDLVRAAKRGGWISLDHLRVPYYENGKKMDSSTVEKHFEPLNELKANGLADRAVLSHDATGHAPGQTSTRFDALMTTFVPMLRAAGYSEDEIGLLTTGNPAKAFTIRRRLL